LFVVMLDSARNSPFDSYLCIASIGAVDTTDVCD